MLNGEFESLSKLPEEVTPSFRQDEAQCISQLLQQVTVTLNANDWAQIENRAKQLIENIRKKRTSNSLDEFLRQYDLSNDEGVALMSIAEALLRIPDKETQDKLIRDKLGTSNWGAHLGKSASAFVNVATWALQLTGNLMKSSQESEIKKLLTKGGDPIVRKLAVHFMRTLGQQFVMGETIQKAVQAAQKNEALGYRYSYDMLGEAALTKEDAQAYFQSYQDAIEALAKIRKSDNPLENPGISVKLSAIHPRYSLSQYYRLQQELYPRIKALVIQAKKANISLTIDAEEFHTLTIVLDVVHGIFKSNILEKWQGFGIAVQAYQKSALNIIEWLIACSQEYQQRIAIRLVKGAYWDTEIKIAQVQGLSGYPVFTRKNATDVNYIACVNKLLNATKNIYPQFATHNALSLATVEILAKNAQIKPTQYEFQCLHGMGEALYHQIITQNSEVACRIYAPVGPHKDLLAYLVRRLLENGANTSFVNQLMNQALPVEEMIKDPIKHLALSPIPHPKIALPKDLYAPERANSKGLDLSNPKEFYPVLKEISKKGMKTYHINPFHLEEHIGLIDNDRFSPVAHSHYLGKIKHANEEITQNVLAQAYRAHSTWQSVAVDERTAMLEKMANFLEANRSELLNLLVYEGGKTIDDGLNEIRESIDYCYYYAYQAKKVFPFQCLKGPTGEENRFGLFGRGVIACISPWNFPLAIFLGQVIASLVAGNCVIAKPASQTPLIAAKAINLLHEAGIPKDVVQLLPGSGAIVGEVLINDERIQGIVFTGSTATARHINHQLSLRKGPIIPLIAETGGQNAMIVDSSALAEQVTQDIIASAFKSAGQRCSALRVLFIQEEIADRFLQLLIGAMAELKVGHPGELATDIGPMIDSASVEKLKLHSNSLKMEKNAILLYEVILRDPICAMGSYFGPQLWEIDTLARLEEEVFGPILHVVRFKSSELDNVISQINNTRYGLTLGIQSRINETVDYICQRVRVGNVYVNRNMVGAVVGVQPFGGEGLSGTGPKAGGPYYLPRLAVERTISINTTAAGGNATLLSSL